MTYDSTQHTEVVSERPDPDADLAGLRERYAGDALGDDRLEPDPLPLFRRWLDDALERGLPEPNAMVVATSGADGRPAARTVLLKGLDERGLVFYTNYDSAKARDLAANPVAEAVFPWHAMQRQVRVTGSVSRVAETESAAYFASRPRESQLGAWASAQSQVVADRASLDAEYARIEERWSADTEIPLPPFWGGYRLAPHAIEFWQGRVGRLHDRIRYRRRDLAEAWTIERLAP